jgi:hypothetical protein
MKPFDIELARKGAKVQTIEGEPVKILTLNAIGDYPIIALVGKEEQLHRFTLKGYSQDKCANFIDLVMVPEVCTVYFNVYHDSLYAYVYSSREHADKNASSGRVTCIKYTYEVK